MLLQPPPSLLAVLNEFDARTDTFKLHALSASLAAAIGDPKSMLPEHRGGGWAESAAFAFRTREVAGGGPWGTHFQPWMTGKDAEGNPYFVPDLREADSQSIVYWQYRARTAKHPVLVARYADLAWDTAKFVPGGKRDIEFARLAVDSYIAASRLDDGTTWGDTRDNLGRALELAISVRDNARTTAAVAANIDYVERTSEDAKVGTYCYLFERLLPASKGPELEDDQEQQLVKQFEEKFDAMTKPESGWFANAHGPQSVGKLLAAYYQRNGRLSDRIRILREVAAAYERTAGQSEAIAAVYHLDSARRLYLEAGLREEAERVQRESQAKAPDAIKCMERISVVSEVKDEDRDRYLAEMTAGGLDAAMSRFAVNFVPRQSEIAKWMKEKDENFIAHKLAPMSKMAHGHIVAQLGDSDSDPDGVLVHETAERAQFSGPWISWVLAKMMGDGFNTSTAVEFIRKTPIFEDNRLGLVERGIEAHMRGDYVQAIHLLLPAIEQAIRAMAYLLGRASNKGHRTGRGVMQFKNLNDLLDKAEWAVPDKYGEDLRLYLLATLAHPKGMNIRNDVAHGLWPESAFHKVASERVLHVLFALAMVRLTKASDSPESGASDSASEA